jgi:hypothetical protein
MKKTFSVVGALFFAVSIAACGGAKKDEATTPTTPPPAETPMAGDAGAAPQSTAPTGNPCSTGAAAAGNPCAKPQ